MKKILATMLAAALCMACGGPGDFNVEKYGAVADGRTINTLAIQQAIDACHDAGGGRVVFPAGVFLSGTIRMRDGVELYLEKDAVLKGSPSFADYPDNEVRYVNAFTHRPDGRPFANKALIFGEDVHRFAIRGEGTIDGSGDSAAFQLGNDSNPDSRRRPCMLLFVRCTNIEVSGLRLTNSAYWLQNYLGCDTVRLSGLTIYNHTNFNQDATDIDASNVLIENCVIDSDDDAICLKSHNADRVVENIVVRNCVLATNCNAIKFGTLSKGGFRNIRMENCTIRAAAEDNVRHWQQTLQHIELPTTVISGIALESVDGALIENVSFSDIVMQGVQTPIFVVLARRNVGQAGNDDFYNSERNTLDGSLRPGRVSGLSFRNIRATSHSRMTSSITAAEGSIISDVVLENVHIDGVGGGTRAEAAARLPEYAGEYPENRMFGFAYPSSGLFVRRVEGLRIDNMSLTVRGADFRPTVVLEEVSGASIRNLTVTEPAGGEAVLRIEKSRAIEIERTTPPRPQLDLRRTAPSEVVVR